ncbi:MAG: NAD(P)-binding domain-containing protein [Burkholderiales bacterium]
MVPAAVVDETIAQLAPLLEAGDTIIDGGNSYYVDDIRRSKALAPKSIDYVDVGTGAAAFGASSAIGVSPRPCSASTRFFRTLAPGIGTIDRTPGRPADKGTAEMGYLHRGAERRLGHFVKMVHNGIEYGVMAAHAEGLSILKAANVGRQTHEVDAVTTPLRDPEHHQYDLDLPEVAEACGAAAA